MTASVQIGLTFSKETKQTPTQHMEGSDSDRHMSDTSADYASLGSRLLDSLGDIKRISWHTLCRSGLLFLPASSGNRGDLFFFHLKLNCMGLQELLGCWIVSTVTQMQETGISMPVGKGFRTLALWHWVDAME